jgi:hypothetical protein
MLYFSEHYLTEMAAASSSESNDDKGKMHELLLAKHLHPAGQLPSHHRAEHDEYGGTPQQVHDRLKKKISPEAYAEIDRHAKQTAEAVKAHMQKHGFEGHEITDVHWTSNRDTDKKPGDHEKTTGIRDPNANADIILTTKHPKTGAKHFVGVSAKYGTEDQPNYRNDGLKALEKKANLKAGTLTDIQQAHDKDMADRLGYTGTKQERHAKYKLDRAAKAKEKSDFKDKGGANKDYIPTSKEAIRARAAEDASVESRKRMARHLDTGFGAMNDHELRNFIRQQVSPPTKIPHIVAHSHVDDNGNATSVVGDMSRIADAHLDNFKNIRVKKGNSIYTQFVGDYNGKERPVAQQIVKPSSGPVKGASGAFKFVSIPKKLQNQQPKQSKETPAAAPAPVKKKPVQSFSQHVVKPMNKPKKTGYGVAGDNPDSPMHNWASGEVAGSKFKSKSEM